MIERDTHDELVTRLPRQKRTELAEPVDGYTHLLKEDDGRIVALESTKGKSAIHRGKTVEVFGRNGRVLGFRSPEDAAKDSKTEGDQNFVVKVILQNPSTGEFTNTEIWTRPSELTLIQSAPPREIAPPDSDEDETVVATIGEITDDVAESTADHLPRGS